LGALLREIRRQDGRGLKEAAYACGVSVSAMSAYEKGAVMPSVAVLARLARYYGVSADRLIRHLADDIPAA
jgi:transcriptional regulator with XRE-family HTH domain